LPSTIERLHGAYASRGLTVLAVNTGEEHARVARWVKEHGVTSRVLLDPDGAGRRSYRVTGTPTVILVGRDGRLVGRAVGPRNWMGEEGRALFEALLTQKGQRQ
jgi:hypothetical protein